MGEERFFLDDKNNQDSDKNKKNSDDKSNNLEVHSIPENVAGDNGLQGVGNEEDVSKLLDYIRNPESSYAGNNTPLSKGHLKGYQWRESKRALEKKERAKAKHSKGKAEDKRFEDAKASFIISIEKMEKAEYGIVTGLAMGRIKVLFEDKYYDCAIDQGLPFEMGQILAVGDHVTFNVRNDKHFIDHLIERKTSLSRLRRDSTRWGGDSAKSEQVIAANVDSAVIVVAAKNPPLHPKFIDRYLVLIQHSNIKPIICVNKADLGIEDENVLAAYKKAGIQVIETSTETGQGVEDLKKAIDKKTVVLVGNSGVGKSSLINSISPEISLKVGEVGEKTGKGRHTTTSSDLISWDENSYIIDTPGIRSLEMANVTRQELELYFDEIVKYSEDCKYSDCTHDVEDECGVKDAVKKGLIDKQRYESYIKILHEIS